MEKNHMKSSSLVEIELASAQMINTHWHGFIELLYVISGQMDLVIGEHHYKMKVQDIAVINANRHHSYRGSSDLLLGRFLISEAKVQDMLGISTVLFWCNSAAEEHKAFGELRAVLNRLLNDSLNDGAYNRIYRESLYYRMMHILCSHFLVQQGEILYRNETEGEENRLQEIFSYIRSNYHRNIRLKDLADTLYLSETYVSKYIKKKCGINFVELVNMVRLEQSMEDLIDTNTPVIKIAMDNGFASVAAYNKYFKERYQTTPTEYRKKIQAERTKKQENKSTEEESRLIQEKVARFLRENPDTGGEAQPQELQLGIDLAQESVPFEKERYLSVINIGPLAGLLNYNLQEQICSSRERIGFTYVRFSDPFGEGTYVDIHASADRLNFGQIDAVLDFLVRNHLKPYFELGDKKMRLLRNTDQAILERTGSLREFDSDEQMHGFHQSFIRHLIRRYGPAEVSTWYFELHEQEDISYGAYHFTFNPMTDEAHQHYFHRFDLVAGAFREALPEVKIGGGGFPVQHYGEEGLCHLFDLWAAGHLKPDCTSLTCCPYHLQKESRYYFEKRSTDVEFVLHNILLVKKALQKSALTECPIHIAEYGVTLSNRNVINDSCYKGAFLIQTVLSCMDEKDILLGSWLFSDLYDDYNDTNRLLFGGAGLVNKNGIPKPSWYAFDFLNAGFPNLVKKNRNILVTRDDAYAFRIVCHNRKELSYSYYARKEDEITADEFPQMFENRESLQVKLLFENIPDGIYRIKRQRINASHGNLLDNWQLTNRETELSMDELEHLRKVTTYQLTVENVRAAGGRMELTFSLEPNEITCIQITTR